MRHSFDEIMKRTRKAITNHHMIEDDQAIMVGLSGGKDSATLLYALKEFLPASKYKYKLAAGHVSLGFPEDDITPLKEYCESLDVPFYYEKTQIGPVVFDIRKETNPCSLCAKMRRGALNNLAKNNGFTKVALAHHQDDVLETLLLKTFFEGNLATFNPVTYLDRIGITVIRPLIYVPESVIAYFVRKQKIPVVESCCPANNHTKRTEMKAIINQITAIAPAAQDRAVSAIEHLFVSRWDGIETKQVYQTYLDSIKEE